MRQLYHQLDRIEKQILLGNTNFRLQQSSSKRVYPHRASVHLMFGCLRKQKCNEKDAIFISDLGSNPTIVSKSEE
jgi:hypothetical protein